MVTKRVHDRLLARVREVCLSLPEVSERLSHGDGIVVSCPAFPGVQDEMVALEPDRFYRPPYVGT